jgi:hypothetical protein
LSAHSQAQARDIPGTTAALKLLTRYVNAVTNPPMLASPELSRLVVTRLHDLRGAMSTSRIPIRWIGRANSAS